MRTRHKDFIAYEGPSLIDGSPIVAVVTGVEVPSRNVKTGRMLQTWILQQDMHPKEAVRTGQDTGICGTCPLKGLNGQLRTCYVRVENAPTNVWKKWKAGGYTHADDDTIRRAVRYRKVRLGAYGEPTAVPYERMRLLTDSAAGWTGYTHRWASIGAEWAGMLMASVEDAQTAQQARLQGWRPFLATDDPDSVPDKAFLCPAEREDDPITCEDCGVCAGTRNGTVMADSAFPWLPLHGAGRKNYRRMLELTPV